MESDGAGDIAGEDLAPILRRPGGEAVCRALVGCSYYRNDPLAETRRCANRSWAIGPSDHCGLVYQRIKLLEKDA